MIQTIDLYNNLLSMEKDERKIALKNLTETEFSAIINMIGVKANISQKKLCDEIEAIALISASLRK